MDSTTIKYQEHDIEAVMRYPVKGFALKRGEAISRHDWFYDAAKGKVVFKLYIEEKRRDDAGSGC